MGYPGSSPGSFLMSSRTRPRFPRHSPNVSSPSDLALTLLANSANPTCAVAAHRTMMARIKGYIDQLGSRPALSPEDIAAAVHISTRYLHKLFEGEHHAVALYLRSLRLQHARNDLLDPRHAHRGIATIAHDCGFGDISGFNRAFKTAYGVKPSELDATAAYQPRASGWCVAGQREAPSP